MKTENDFEKRVLDRITLIRNKKMEGGFLKVLNKDEVKESLDDIYGLKQEKEEVLIMLEAFLQEKDFKDKPKGVVLYGSPGVGKTMLARGIAKEFNLPFLYTTGGAAFSGVEEIKKMFEVANQHSPCILCIDEFEVIGSRNEENNINKYQISEFLSQLDGIEKNNPIFIIGITNYVEKLDHAIMRAGRFSKVIYTPEPNKSVRMEWLIKNKEKYQIDEEDIELIAEHTKNYSIIDLKNTFDLIQQKIKYSMNSTRNENTLISYKIFDKYQNNTLEKNKEDLLHEQDEKLVAIHETGHAVLSYLLKNDYSNFVKMSIIPKDRYNGMVSMQDRSEENKVLRQNDIITDVSILLGGLCAELIYSDDMSAGTYSDLKIAKQKVDVLVKKLGCNLNFIQKRIEFQKNKNINNLNDFDEMFFSINEFEEMDSEIEKIKSEEEKKKIMDWIRKNTLTFLTIENKNYKIKSFFKDVLENLIKEKELYKKDLDLIAKKYNLKEKSFDIKNVNELLF